MNPIKVLLADDHPIVREGLRAYLSSQKNLQVVGEASDGLDVIEKARALSPDIVLMDIGMPRMNGIETTRQILSSRLETKVLILSVHDEREYLLESLRAGARGYILKDSAPGDVTRAIEAVHAGDPFFTVGTARLLLDEMRDGVLDGEGARSDELTEREKEIIGLVCEGLKTSEIALRLGVSARTIDAHRRNVKRKLGISTLAGLTRYALKNRLTRS